MTNFKKIKFMTYNNVPNPTSSDEIYAVPFDLAGSTYAPNYGAQVTLNLGTTYTVGSGALAGYSKGYLLAGCTARSDDSAPWIDVNGHTSCLMGYDHDYGGDLSGYCVFIPVKTGDYFTVPNSNGYPIARFIPTKG